MGHGVVGPETIDLKDVRAFCAVLDAGSVTAAAKLLRETKGSVSRRVTRLEKALGVTLLRRSPRLVQATDDGTLYRAKVGQALELLEDASLSVQRARETPRGRLRVTAPSDFAVGLLPDLVSRFVERHPEVHVEMVASDARLDFDAQQLDCALRVGTLRDSNLKVHKLLDVRMGFFASPRYLDAAPPIKKPEDLLAHRIVGYTNMPRPLEITFERGGVASTVTLDATLHGDGAFANRVVVLGGGIGGMPRVIAAPHLASGDLVEILPSYELSLSRPLSLLYPSASFVPAKVRAFRDYLIEAFANLAPRPGKGAKRT